MTIEDLNTRLDVAMRRFIKERDHILTGAMYRSVMFDCQQTETGLRLKFSAAYYMKFLDHGEFINDFWELPTTRLIIEDYVAGLIEESL